MIFFSRIIFEEIELFEVSEKTFTSEHGRVNSEWHDNRVTAAVTVSVESYGRTKHTALILGQKPDYFDSGIYSVL